jgi:N-methylhydantoinase B/oxoprolinase/acetone carboxylase alpha subunit
MFDILADERKTALLTSAYSSLLKEGMDASSALCTTGGEIFAQAASIPMRRCVTPLQVSSAMRR